MGFFGIEKFNHEYMWEGCIYTPEKNMESQNEGLDQMIFLFNGVIFRWATKKYTLFLSIIILVV